MSRLALGEYFVFVFVAISFIKLLSYFLLMEYRERVKGNLRNVVIVGKNKKTDQLRKVFTDRREYGYNFLTQFAPKGGIFDLQACFDYILNNNVDEIYCSISELKNEELTKFINFSDNKLKNHKFNPQNKKIIVKKLNFEY